MDQQLNYDIQFVLVIRQHVLHMVGTENFKES